MDIQPVTQDQFEQVYEVLKDFDITSMGKKQWKVLFTHEFPNNEDYFGYALWDRKKVVGFIGLIFSHKKNHGETQKFANITSIILKKAYRKYCISLLLNLRNLEDYTLTNLTPSKEVYRMLKEFGFKDLENEIHVYPLFANKSVSLFGVKILIIPKDYLTLLTKDEKQVYEDHQHQCCDFCVINKETKHCLVVFKKVTRKKLPFSHILYQSNTPIFRENFNRLQLYLFKKNFTPFTLIDSRIIGGEVLGVCKIMQIKYPRVYKSSSLVAHEVPNIYSEFTLLPI